MSVDVCAARSPLPKKHKFSALVRKKPTQSGEEVRDEIIANVFIQYSCERPSARTQAIIERTAEVTGLSVRQVNTALDRALKRQTGTHDKLPIGNKPWRIVVDEILRDKIQKIVDDEFEKKGKILTRSRLQATLNNTLPEYPYRSLRVLGKILRKMRITFRRNRHGPVHTECEERFVPWRRSCGQLLCEAIDAGKTVYATDETFFMSGDTAVYCYRDKKKEDNPQSMRKPGASGTFGPKSATKGQRLAVAHVIGPNGFVPDCLLTIRSDGRLSDYHSDFEVKSKTMDSTVYEAYMRNQVIPALRHQNAVLVTDNAPYHGAFLDRFPRDRDTNMQMRTWCASHSVDATPFKTKKALWAHLKILKETDARYKDKYVIDELCRENGIQLVRLPPYHPFWNPIEYCWAEWKRRGRERNTEYLNTHSSASLHEIDKMTHEIFDEIPAEFVAATFRHCTNIWRKYAEETNADFEDDADDADFVREVFDGDGRDDDDNSEDEDKVDVVFDDDQNMVGVDSDG